MTKQQRIQDKQIIIFIIFIIIGCMLCGCIKEINYVSLGTEVQTTDKYEQIFNDSFVGHVIIKNCSIYTVRDTEGNDRILDRHWLENTAKINWECNRSEEL